MGLSEMIGKIVNAPLRALGLQICRYPLRRPHNEDLSLRTALGKVLARSVDIGTVIDVGASDGQWSKVAMEYYPRASYCLIEAQEVHVESLEAFKAENPNVDFVTAAAADVVGEVHFRADKPFGGAASHSGFRQHDIRVPATTIDTLVSERGLKPPFLIKLDTHGFEVEILEGTADTLRDTALIVVETYNFSVGKRLRFHEMCAFLESKGFRSIGFCDPLHRPRDGFLWQMDLFFMPSDRPEFESTAFE